MSLGYFSIPVYSSKQIMEVSITFGNQMKAAFSSKPATQAGLEEEVKKPAFKFPTWAKNLPAEEKTIYVIDNEADLREYLSQCQELGIASFDWETAPTPEVIDWFTKRINDTKARMVHAQSRDLLKELAEEVKELEDTLNFAALDPHKSDICTFSITCRINEAAVVFLKHTDGNNFVGNALDILNEMIFKNKNVIKVAFNMVFEQKFAMKRNHVFLGTCVDPMIMIVRVLQVLRPSDIADPKRPNAGKGLKAMAKAYLWMVMQNFEDVLIKSNAKYFSETSTKSLDVIRYSAEDADAALQLYYYFNDIAKQIVIKDNYTYSDWLHRIEMPFTRAIGIMEYNGLHWDEELCRHKKVDAETKLLQCQEEIKAIAHDAGFLINTGKTGKTGDVYELLFNVFGAPSAKESEKTGKSSMDYNSLLDIKFMVENKLYNIDEEEDLKDPVKAAAIAKRASYEHEKSITALVNILLKLGNYSTLLSSHIEGRSKYVNPFTGRIHAQYAPWTETGRLSSSNPNGQNVPRTDNDEFGVRNLYKAEPGNILMLVDFSGFELRLIAWMAGDEHMLKIFNEKGDMHMATAMTLTGKKKEDVTREERQWSKVGNFTVTYCGTAYSLQDTFKTNGVRKSIAECEDIINAIYRTYPKITVFQNEKANESAKSGYAETIYGYRRLLPYINSMSRSYRKSDERKAANTPIQGSAADIMKRCQNEILEICAEKFPTVRMCAQIHDEIIFEMPDNPELIAVFNDVLHEVMEKPPIDGFPLPLEVEVSVAYNWGEKKKYKKP